jgi:hypothetical protein
MSRDQTPENNNLVSTTGGESFSIRAERHAPDITRVPGQRFADSLPNLNSG